MIDYKKVFTGSMCNNDCLCCEFADRNRENRFLSEIKADFKDHGETDSVEIIGGEPALRSDFFDLIDLARQQNYVRIKLRTNGRAFSDWDLARSTIEYGVHLFEVKVYGFHAPMHDLISRQDGSFIETVQGITNLKSFSIPAGEKSKEPFVAVRIPICKDNYEYIEDIVRFLIPLRIDRIILSFVDHRLPISDISSHVSNAIETAVFSRIWILTERIPLCLMPGYEHHVSETFRADADYTPKQAESCSKCIYSNLCSGIAADYLEKKGPSEFVPVTKSEYLSDLEELHQIVADNRFR